MQSRLIAKAELEIATIYLHNTGNGYAVTTFLNGKPFDRETTLNLDEALEHFAELVRREEEL